MKRMSYFVMALALMLGLTQCKKESIEPQNEGGVRITLNVENSGNRHAVNTELGTVEYQDGDVIYVGDGSTYIGTLIREGGTFSGTINPEPADGADIHFYFLGGLTPSVTPEAGWTSDFTVNISDQTSKLPVLSYEYTTYYEGTTEYSCELKNKCGLVRFPLENAAGSVKVSGMHTEATISFDGTMSLDGTPGITTTDDVTGQVSLYSVSETEKWAILLPQGRVTDAYLQGVQVDVPQVTVNARIVSIPTIVNPATMIYLDDLSNWYTEAQDGAIIYGDLLTPSSQLHIANGATVTLRDATTNKNGRYFENANFAGITCNGDATIILEGENIVKGFSDNYPGIQINEGSTLTIMGNGSLTVSPRNTDSRAAGIGAGNFNENCGNIVITGGNISATGGKGAAAIGGCEGYSCGYITITDGVTRVEATKGGDGVWDGGQLCIGKGAGSDSGCGTVTIGGTVYSGGADANQPDGLTFVYSSSTPTPPTPSTGTTITWDNTNVFNSDHNGEYVGVGYYNQHATYEGITISFSGGEFSNSIFAVYFDEEERGFFNLFGNQGDSFTFTAPQGKKFTKIEIIDNEYPSFTAYGDWTMPEENRIEWNGTPNREVTLGGTNMTIFGNLNSIVFTLVDEE